MPKSREAGKPRNPNCSFCGTHKDDVPLMVSSGNNPSNICTWCAMGVIEQTFKHGLEIENRLREFYKPKEPAAPKIEIASKMPDKVDLAVSKALKNG